MSPLPSGEGQGEGDAHPPDEKGVKDLRIAVFARSVLSLDKPERVGGFDSAERAAVHSNASGPGSPTRSPACGAGTGARAVAVPPASDCPSASRPGPIPAHRPIDARSAERAFCVSLRRLAAPQPVSDAPSTDSDRLDAPRPDDAADEARPDALGLGTTGIQTLEDRLRTLADEAAEDSGLYIVGVAVRGRPGSRVVEVYADGDGAGIDELAGLSRRLSFMLDTEDPVKGHYRLDVSTPGADRPLADIRQYPQHVGRTLVVRYATAAGDAEATGTLAEATPDAITLQPEAGDAVVVAVADLVEARVALPW